MKNIWRVVSYTFFGIVILIAVLLIFSKVPLPGNYKVLTVFSGSMEPSIKTGSVIVIKPAEDYKFGDIISFKEIGSEELVTHRIVNIDSSGRGVFYQTKGDANNTPDWDRVPKENVVGRVWFSIPYLGYILNGIRNPIIFTFLIVVPSAIIIYEEAKKIKGEVKKKKRYKKAVKKRKSQKSNSK